MTATSRLMPQIGKHINGAITLANLRGEQNFKNEWTKTMLSFVKLRMVSVLPSSFSKEDLTNALKTLGPCSHSFVQLPLNDEVQRSDCENQTCSSDPKDAPSQLANIALAICGLRRELNQSSDGSLPRSSVISILDRSQDLDRLLTEWRSTLPPFWETNANKPLLDQREIIIYPDSAHEPYWLGGTATYPTMQVAELLNRFRTHQITLQTVRIRCASFLATPTNQDNDLAAIDDFQARSIIEKAQRICLSMADGICASAPYLLGNLPIPTQRAAPTTTSEPPHPQHPHPQNNASAPKESTTRPHLRQNMGCYILLQPLIMARSVPNLPDLQKKWMRRQALEICRRTGMDVGMVEKRFIDMDKAEGETCGHLNND